LALSGLVSDALWDYAEIALLEHQSSKLLADIAEIEGFKVERGVADLKTVFVAIYGSGKCHSYFTHFDNMRNF